MLMQRSNIELDEQGRYVITFESVGNSKRQVKFVVDPDSTQPGIDKILYPLLTVQGDIHLNWSTNEGTES